jgi:cytochrome c oxidase subunit 4
MNSKESRKPLFIVWAALMLLLFLTWGFARFDLGAANTPIALMISGLKMSLVILIFMEVRVHSHSVWIFAVAGFFWFLIMVALTSSDYITRGRVRSASPPTADYPAQPLVK